MDAATSEACLDILEESGLRAPVMDSLTRAVEQHLLRRSEGAYRVGAVLFSNQYGILGMTPEAQEILKRWK